jgi:hypothetical protein
MNNFSKQGMAFIAASGITLAAGIAKAEFITDASLITTATTQVETFEGLAQKLPGGNITRILNTGYMIPSVQQPFTFFSNVVMVVPEPPNNGPRLPPPDPLAIIGDFSLGNAYFDLIGNGELTDTNNSTMMPTPTAYLATNNVLNQPILFKLPRRSSGVGAYITGEPQNVEIKVFGTNKDGLYAIGQYQGEQSKTVPIDQWKQNFLGWRDVAGTITHVQFTGRYIVIDDLTFQTVSLPSSTAMMALGLGTLLFRKKTTNSSVRQKRATVWA